MFQYTVQRLVALNRLCMTLNQEFEMNDSQNQMLRDWNNVDMVLIIDELGFIREEAADESNCYEEVIWMRKDQLNREIF